MDTYEDAGYQSFVKIAKEESNDFMELPREKDGTILLSTVQAQFPSCIGLKYKSSSGGWRGIRSADNVLDTPFGGWGETIYYITESEALKRKASETSDGPSAVKSRKSDGLLEDLIVFGLPFAATDDDLKQYFTKACGELAFHEVKYDRETKRSRGFGFIRFATEEGAKEALNKEHEIMGRKLEVRPSKKKDNPLRLFVGRLPSGTTQEALKEYFTEFGELSDIFFPSPFRGFGFITYASQEEGKRAVRMNHVFEGRRLNVVVAEAKDERPPRSQRQQSPSNYTWNGGERNRSSSYGQDRERTQDRYDSRNNQRGGNDDRYESQNKQRDDRYHDSQHKRGGGNEDRYDSQNKRAGGNEDRYDPRSTQRAGNEDRMYDSHYKQGGGGNEDRYASQNKQRAGNEERFDSQNKQQGGGNDMGGDLKSMLLAFLSSQK